MQVGTQIGSKIGLNFERPILQKVWKNQRKITVFKALGVEVGSQIRSKIDQKLKSKLERLLASIFNGF